MDPKEHQKELAQSGYRLPTEFYAEDPNQNQPSAEQKSGDGGSAAADLDASSSEHGYKGEMLTQEQLRAETQKSAQGAQGGATGSVTYASPAAEQAAKDAGLTDADFAGIEGSGANGGYTKGDVDKAAAKKAEK